MRVTDSAGVTIAGQIFSTGEAKGVAALGLDRRQQELQADGAAQNLLVDEGTDPLGLNVGRSPDGLLAD